MNHSEALKLGVVEKYFLNELPPDQRDEFEEHYFDCSECAVDVSATAAFMDAAKKEFQAHPVAAPNPTRMQAKNRFSSFGRPVILAWALAASLLVIGYQNVFVYPHTHEQLARLEVPAILPAVSLVTGNSRGNQINTLTARPDQPFLLSFDIPAQPRYASYTCLLYSPTGALSWSVQVSAQMAKDTVTINAPAGNRIAGVYTLAIQGNMEQQNPGPSPDRVELARYPFNVVVLP